MLLWDDFYFLLPEIFLASSILGLLLLSLFQKTSVSSQENRLIQLSILALCVTMVLIWASPEKGIFIQGMLETSPTIRLFKMGFLILAALTLSLSTISWVFKMQFVFEYPVLLLMAVLGGLLSIAAGDFLVLFVGLELQALPLYVLVALNNGSPDAAEAGVKYFTLGALATGFFLFGVSLVYGTLGTIEFQSFHNLLSILAEGAEGINAFPTYFLLGVVLIMGALFFKLSLVPFHMWAPDVYEGAKPTTVLFLATGVKVVGLFVLFKLFMGPFEAVRFAFEPLLVFVAGVSVIVGALGGVFQDKFQRLLAYSGISHMGFLLAPLVCGPVGIHSLLTYLLIYMPMVVLAFMLLMIFKKRSESSLLYLFELKGLGKTSPLFAFFMAILMFSLAGLPPLGGFLGKLSVLMAVLKEEHFFLAVIMVLSSVVSCFYYLRVIKLMYFDKNGENEVAAQQAWELCFQNRLILCFLVLFILGFAAFGPFIPLPCCSMS